jgi:hypothetical protein
LSVPVWIATGSTSTALSGFDIINLFAAAASIILAVVALALSIFFFVQGKNSADQSEKSAQEISASVTRLEKLFDSLYSDTFTMMRDTVTDMRRHVWKVSPEALNSARDLEIKEQLEHFQDSLLEQLGEVSKRVGLTDTKIADLREEMGPIFQRTLTEQGEAVKTITHQMIENNVLDVLQGGATNLDTIRFLTPYTDGMIVDALFALRHDGSVTWDGPPGRLTRHQPIKLAGPEARKRLFWSRRTMVSLYMFKLSTPILSNSLW